MSALQADIRACAVAVKRKHTGWNENIGRCTEIPEAQFLTFTAYTFETIDSHSKPPVPGCEPSDWELATRNLLF